MPEPILDPAYWTGRLEVASRPHHAIFKCDDEKWRRVAEKHKVILASLIRDNDSIMDAGCGWGRLLTLLPQSWTGRYWGIDLCPEFIKMASEKFPSRDFTVSNLAEITKDKLPLAPEYDWGIMISIRPMIQRNCDHTIWKKFERVVRGFCVKLLYLEYDENDEGSIE